MESNKGKQEAVIMIIVIIVHLKRKMDKWVMLVSQKERKKINRTNNRIPADTQCPLKMSQWGFPDNTDNE